MSWYDLREFIFEGTKCNERKKMEYFEIKRDIQDFRVILIIFSAGKRGILTISALMLGQSYHIKTSHASLVSGAAHCVGAFTLVNMSNQKRRFESHLDYRAGVNMILPYMVDYKEILPIHDHNLRLILYI
jgi:hypothetical protein